MGIYNRYHTSYNNSPASSDDSKTTLVRLLFKLTMFPFISSTSCEYLFWIVIAVADLRGGYWGLRPGSERQRRKYEENTKDCVFYIINLNTFFVFFQWIRSLDETVTTSHLTQK